MAPPPEADAEAAPELLFELSREFVPGPPIPGAAGSAGDRLRTLEELGVEVARQTQEERASRYANAVLLDEANERTLPIHHSLKPKQQFRLRLDIGPMSEESQVTGAEEFPDKVLPRDVDIDVMVSSTDFRVIAEGSSLEPGLVAHGKFFLPGDGSPAVTPDRSRYLTFRLTAPDQPGTARCRIGYYYRNTLVQSQQLTAGVDRRGGLRIVTDFTVSRDLTGLERIPDRRRISVLTNLNEGGSHQIVLRSVDPRSSAITGRTFVVNEETVGMTIGQIRTVLTNRAPEERRRSKRDLEQDLRELAVPGWTLYTQLASQNLEVFDDMFKSPDAYVVQVLRPTSSGFVVPWGLIYEIPLISDTPAVCPLVDNWNERDPLLKGSPRTCPHGPHKEDVLCPIGFWGFRYAIEQLSSSDEPVLEIEAAADCSVVVAQTQFEVDLAALERHVSNLRAVLDRRLPKWELKEAKSKAAVRTLLGQDLPIVYFYCHGERRNIVDPNTWLAVGEREIVTAQEVIGWFVTWRREGTAFWDKVRPLVFVNACHSLAIYPATLVSYLDAFVTTGRAAGIIGTEVKVNQTLASEFAERFFDLLLTGASTVDSVLRTIRFEYLGAGNLLGLVYTPYCWADLRVRAASSPPA